MENLTHVSLAIRNASSVDEAVRIINAGTVEGCERIEFTSDMLAGLYAAESVEREYVDGDEGLEDQLNAHLDFVAKEGANFDSLAALKYGFQAWKAQNL